MIVPIIKGRSNNEMVGHIIKNKKEDEKYLWNYLIEKFLYNILEPIIFDVKDIIIMDKLIILFNELLIQNQNIFGTINKAYINELNKICQEMETSIINFIINSLFPKSFFMKEELQQKVLSLIKNII